MVLYFIAIDVFNSLGQYFIHLNPWPSIYLNIHILSNSKSTSRRRKSHAVHHSSWSASQSQWYWESTQFPANLQAHIWASGTEPAQEVCISWVLPTHQLRGVPSERQV